MKVFISWSGEPSRTVAFALRRWLPDVIQGVQPWMSEADIEAGTRWSRGVQNELSQTRFGIICVTRDNQSAPWILFEAGALAKTIEDTYVCSYLIDLEPSDISQGPLTQFQAKRAVEGGTRDLVKAINSAAKEEALVEEKLNRTFDKWWPDLRDALSALPQPKVATPQRTNEDMLGELLVETREIRRMLYSGASNMGQVSLFGDDTQRLTIDDAWSRWVQTNAMDAVTNTIFKRALLKALGKTGPSPSDSDENKDEQGEG